MKAIDTMREYQRRLRRPTMNHLTGTSRDVLLEQSIAVTDALRSVIQKLIAAWPDGRDYPDGDGVGAAADSFGHRREIILKMQSEFEALSQYIADSEGAP